MTTLNRQREVGGAWLANLMDRATAARAILARIEGPATEGEEA